MKINTTLKGSLFCLFLILAAGCQKQKDLVFKVEGFAIGTEYEILYISRAKLSLQEGIDSIVNSVDHALSTYKSNSYLTCFNLGNCDEYAIKENSDQFPNDIQHLINMIQLSTEVSRATSGAFDPSAAPLFALYDHAQKNNISMQSEAIPEVLKHVGMQNIQFDPKDGFPVKLDSLTMLNFNAVAKGYLVDLICEYINSQGSGRYMVEIGGEVRTSGYNPQGAPWVIGINVPTSDAKKEDLFTSLSMVDKSMATSGNYRNFYVLDGVEIGHTLDPRTGAPVQNNLLSAAVLTEHCAVADAYATACMVMGLEESIKLIKSDPKLSAYFIYEDNNQMEGVYVE